MILLPAMLLGLTPLIVSGWLATLSRKVAALFSGSWPVSLLLVVVVLGWIGGRPLLRAAEQGFWSLNSVVVQPGYALCRECLRHLMERLVLRNGAANPTRLRAATAAGAGLILCGVGLGVVVLAWPASRWVGTIEDLASPHRLLVPALANAAVLLGGYLAAAALCLGLRRRDDAPARATSSSSIRRRQTARSGASRTFPTCTSSASAMGFASRAAGPVRAATTGCSEVLARLEHEHKRRAASTSFSSPAT